MSNPLLIPELRELIANEQHEVLRALCTDMHSADVAEFLSALEPPEAWAVVQTCGPALRSEIFSRLDIDLRLQLAETLPRDVLAVLLSEMSADDRVDLVQSMPEPERESVLGAMARAEREDIRRLAAYAPGTVGAAMTSDYVVLSPGMNAAEAISKLRLEAPNKETIYYSYVVDERRRLIGFVSLKDIILARPKAEIGTIMHPEVLSARTSDDQEVAARMIQKYDLLALPVVADDGALAGIVTHDDAMDIITQEQTEDMEKLMAIRGPHEAGGYLRTSAWQHFRRRVLWILVLAALGLVSGFIVTSFQGLLIQFTILASFMPMLADTGGNTGAQSSTLVVRALALEEIKPVDVLAVIFKEFKVALPLGLVLSSMAFLRVLFWSETGFPEGISRLNVGFAIGLALGLQVVSATLIGAALPLLAVRFKRDPAIIASPALTTVVDITGLFLYFTIVKLVLGL